MKKLLFVFLLSTAVKFSSAQAWLPMGEGTLGEVRTMAADTINHRLFVGGEFSVMDTLQGVGNAAIWDGVKWNRLIHDGGLIGFTDYLGRMLIWNNYLYYSKHSGSQTYSISRMNLSTFTTEYIHNFDGGISDLVIYHDTLYACGDFTGMISKWDGVNWISITDNNSLGNGWGYGIRDMEVYNDKLYVAGDFEITSPWQMKGAAAWNGTTWEDIDSNLTANLGDFGVFYNAINAYHDKIYLGGLFDTTHGCLGNGLLVLNNGYWENTGQDFWIVQTMTLFNDKLFIGGSLESNGAPFGHSIIIYNDTTFHIAYYDSLCPGGPINCFEEMNNDLFVGGDFSIVDNFNSTTYARAIAYLDPDTIISGIKENLIMEEKEIRIYPNPANNALTIKWSGIANQVAITDMLSREIISYKPKPSAEQLTISVADLQAGIYFCAVISGKGKITSKVVKE